ncbi:MAG: HD domain-containing protein [Candidatus Peregrinibacteria bacterium]
MQWQDLLPAISYLSPEDLALVRQAFDFCIEAHEGQLRKSGMPYATHPIEVARILAAMGADADALIAALLHDVVEDTSTTLATLTKKFGPSVGGLIDALTKLDDAEIRAHPTLDEETESLRKMVTTMEKDVRLMVIKLADRLHNMRTIDFLPTDRKNAFAQETYDVYVKLADRLSMQKLKDELEALCLAVLEPELFPKLLELRNANRPRGTTIAQAMEKKMRESGQTIPASMHMEWEPKSWNHLRDRVTYSDKAAIKRASLTVGFRCDAIAECYAILGALHQIWPYKVLTFKDFINTPAINGYRGLHTTILLEDGMSIRCKIRTTDMETYARKGIASLCFDQKAQGFLEYLPWLKNILSLSADTTQKSTEFLESLQSDILGKSITVYGPDGTAIQLPHGATALDGALYLFKEQALYQTLIVVNGEAVPPFTELTHSVSLAIITEGKRTVEREWLGWVRTGLATAQIRGAFSEESERKMIVQGRTILQQALTKESRGFLAEFRESVIIESVRSLGYHSLNRALIAITDGHLSPTDVIARIFRQKGTDASSKQLCIVRLTLPTLGPSDIIRHFTFLEKKYGLLLGDLRVVSPIGREEAQIVLRLPLDQDEQRAIVTELAATGAIDISVTPRNFTQTRAIIVLLTILILWGLDPVFARFLLRMDTLTPIDFTLLRFWSLGLVFSAITLIRRRHSIIQPIKLLHPLLWLSSVLMMALALTTYLALSMGTATQYEVPMTASGLLIATMALSLRWKKGLLLWALFGSALLLLFSSPTCNTIHAITIMLAFTCFVAFLIVSNRYMQQQMISRRTLEYYTAMLLIGSACSAPLLFFSSPRIFDPLTITEVALFSFIFIGIPYYLYYTVLPRWKTRSLIPFSFVMLSATFLGEIALTRSVDLYTLGAGLLMILMTLLLQERRMK